MVGSGARKTDSQIEQRHVFGLTEIGAVVEFLQDDQVGAGLGGFTDTAGQFVVLGLRGAGPVFLNQGCGDSTCHAVSLRLL